MPVPTSAASLSLPRVASAFRSAAEAAKRFRGATAPNPPVGCALLDDAGDNLAIAAHTRAGQPHAEAAAIDFCRRNGTVARIDTVVVTLEPCNHWGRTPPCTGAILATPARHVWIGAADPDLGVGGGGIKRLRDAGVDVHLLEDGDDGELGACGDVCRDLIAPFAKQRLSGRPWVTVKQAIDEQGSMIPPPGRKTFTSDAALTIGHRLRKRADAILTGSGTVLADDPVFTVRRVPDHPGKRRRLVILDRRGRVPRAYREAAELRGFEVAIARDLGQALDELGRQGVLEVLVEAGPAVTASVLDGGLWDEHVVLRKSADGEPDRIEVEMRQGNRNRRSYAAAADLEL
ncbi:MAG TPA: bifunctional diaminohydroxyphosphoribosylaminopyrimidine deaminase/5-amino-6-(5-phosphoribosylamino)uracil reductase RibD [Lichenihabitans sp.]|nr:bifunctional diaminohydroxyphosphoribosylaminopyrimidine deaminase/5-amino-6-(5-phosphoribosylamino)uracil reductase RibD [Lichenihabitans sp.]